MTSRSFQYFQKRKVYRRVLRPIAMLEQQHYGPPIWLAEFVQAWEQSVVILNHLSTIRCRMYVTPGDGAVCAQVIRHNTKP
jgi:hypothetical protein